VRASRWVLREAGGETPPAYSPAKARKFWVPTWSESRKATWTGASSQVPAQPGVVGDPGMCGSSLCGNREISGLANGVMPAGPHREDEES
jgi:hypothetical protein